MRFYEYQNDGDIIFSRKFTGCFMEKMVVLLRFRDSRILIVIVSRKDE